MDKIIIRDLEVDTIIGIFEHERDVKQQVIVNVVLGVDLVAVGLSDDFRDAVNYREVEEIIYDTASESSYFLVEKLASVLVDKLLSLAGVLEVDLTIDKPKAAKYARSIAININRKK